MFGDVTLNCVCGEGVQQTPRMKLVELEGSFADCPFFGW